MRSAWSSVSSRVAQRHSFAASAAHKWRRIKGRQRDSAVAESTLYLISTLQPLVIDITKVVVCFSTPTTSTTSPFGNLIVGNRCKMRTTV